MLRNWDRPEILIPGADQKDHILWGREWYLCNRRRQNLLFKNSVKICVARLIFQACNVNTFIRKQGQCTKWTMRPSSKTVWGGGGGGGGSSNLWAQSKEVVQFLYFDMAPKLAMDYFGDSAAILKVPPGRPTTPCETCNDLFL